MHPELFIFKNSASEKFNLIKFENIALTKLHVNNPHLIQYVDDLSEASTCYIV